MSIKPLTRAFSIAVLSLLLIFVALGPAKWTPRTGFGWEFDHFVGYFAFALMFCLLWPQPLVVGGILILAALLLDGLQAFMPDRSSDLIAGFYGAGGVLMAALIAAAFIRARTGKPMHFCSGVDTGG
jgi:VanZ family protein